MAKESCLKRVFDDFCVGGDINQLARKKPETLYRQGQGERLALVDPEKKDTLYVLGYKGRIYKVVRKYSSATLLKFDDLLGLLTQKYGASRDLSEFPGYARSQASRVGAIRRGDGQALHVWQPQGQQWYIRLRWNREFGVSLEYVAEHLAGSPDVGEESGY